MTRSTSNANVRGNTAGRRARKLWLLRTFGDGEIAPCWKCAVPLDFETITVGRVIPGCEGGTYARDNIRPECGPCNSSDGGRLGAQRAAAAREVVAR